MVARVYDSVTMKGLVPLSPDEASNSRDGVMRGKSFIGSKLANWKMGMFILKQPPCLGNTGAELTQGLGGGVTVNWVPGSLQISQCSAFPMHRFQLSEGH